MWVGCAGAVFIDQHAERVGERCGCLIRRFVHHDGLEFDDDRFRRRTTRVCVREIPEFKEHVRTAGVGVHVRRRVVRHGGVRHYKSRSADARLREAHTAQRARSEHPAGRHERDEGAAIYKLEARWQCVLELEVRERSRRNRRHEAEGCDFTDGEICARCARVVRGFQRLRDAEDWRLAEVVIHARIIPRCDAGEADAGQRIRARRARAVGRGEPGADGVCAVGVVGGLSLGDGVSAGPQIAKGIRPARASRHYDGRDRAQVVCAGEGDGHARDAAFKSVERPVAIEIAIHVSAE